MSKLILNISYPKPRRAIRKLLKDLYNCQANCKSIVCNQSEGMIPRHICGQLKNPKIMVVGLNPGRMNSIERLIFEKGRQNANLYLYTSVISEHYFRNDNRNFARNLRLLLKEALGSIDAIFEACCFSNLVKCESNPQNSDLKNAKETCFNMFLKQEIADLNPKAILALGNEVHYFLNRNKIDNILVKHPSQSFAFWKSKAKVQREAEKIKTALKPKT